ncbi:nuclear transport factor 2 family protein [Holzapfeliella sp. He02]|uniref:Nuclear transport factor 2 family protein n=1 Tax=Holzapfeliella saturejae TaxID=3082953 RepID=A0ABU8SFB3_9LACO
MTNKELVKQFYEDVFTNGDLSKLDEYMKEDYIQHNPTVEDGRAGFKKFIEKFLTFNPTIEIIQLSGDDDLVYVFFKCTMGNGHINKVCDIYRLEDGQLAEHWDILQHNVENVESVNNNGIF